MVTYMVGLIKRMEKGKKYNYSIIRNTTYMKIVIYVHYRDDCLRDGRNRNGHRQLIHSILCQKWERRNDCNDLFYLIYSNF